MWARAGATGRTGPRRSGTGPGTGSAGPRAEALRDRRQSKRASPRVTSCVSHVAFVPEALSLSPLSDRATAALTLPSPLQFLYSGI